MPGRLAADAASGRLEVGFPGIDRDLELRIGVRPPQFTALEAHRIEPAPVLAETRRVAVREHVAATHAVARADRAPPIARQARVPARVLVAGAYAVAFLEPRRRFGLARNRCSAREHPVDVLGRQNALHRLGIVERSPGRELLRADQA